MSDRCRRIDHFGSGHGVSRDKLDSVIDKIVGEEVYTYMLLAILHLYVERSCD
mgnify:CR=1 FL=1